MTLKFEELRVLQVAEKIADLVWSQIFDWEPLAREVVGKQFARALDSIGANIAEAFGRYHYGEKIQFLYYARGSLFESKYWLNRAKSRDLMSTTKVEEIPSQLTILARQLNAFSANLKAKRRGKGGTSKKLGESVHEYEINLKPEIVQLITKNQLEWLQDK